MYSQLAAEHNNIVLGGTYFFPTISELESQFNLKPHVVIQHYGDVIAAGPNSFHMVFCEVHKTTLNIYSFI